MDIIGIFHANRNLNRVANYINSNYSSYIDVLLELDPNHGSDTNTFFMALEKRLFYSTCIYGDKYALAMSPKREENLKHYRLIESKVQNTEYVPTSNKEVFRDMKDLATSFFMEKMYHLVDSLSPKKINIRNQGLDEMIKESSPDLVVVGGAHAFALKKTNPDANMILLLCGPMDFYISSALLGPAIKYGVKPDKILIY